jgi:uncharacterized membrane protein YeaQ/YmgE (transglycosylase-associated protein family)
MQTMGWLAWIIMGAIAGWLASVVVRSRFGLIGNIVVGIGGALIGGFLSSVVGVSRVTGLNGSPFDLIGVPATTGFSVWSVLVAFIGAVMLLAATRMLNVRRGITT